MKWLEQLTRFTQKNARMERLAEAVAEVCFESVWQNTRDQVVGMAPAELRGYVRVRAASALRRKLDVLLEEPENIDLRPSLVYALATESMVRRIANHVQATRAPRVVLPRAA